MSAEKPQRMSKKATDNNGKRVYPPSTSRVHLKTFEDVRRLLSVTINDLRQQKIDPVVARPVMYGCSVLLQVFEGKLIEQDIIELQQIARERFSYGGEQ
jgi:hypothetical protein